MVPVGKPLYPLAFIPSTHTECGWVVSTSTCGIGFARECTRVSLLARSGWFRSIVGVRSPVSLLVCSGQCIPVTTTATASRPDSRKCPIEKQFRCVFVDACTQPLSIVSCCKTAPVSCQGPGTKYAPRKNGYNQCHILSQKITFTID